MAEQGVKVQLARGIFAGKGTADEIYKDNMHLNPKGHHLYAEFIEARIKAESKHFQAWAGGKLGRAEP
jgi:lysophospholipase L1-like esterase